MGVSTTVDIDGIDVAVENLDELPEEIRRRIADKINEAALLARTVAIKRLKQRQSGYSTGALRGTIAVRQNASASSLEAIVAAGGEETQEGGFDYSLAVEFGTRPHFPPVKAVTGQTESLDIWVRRMNPSPPEGMEDASESEVNEAVAFLIARDISRTGTKEMPFMRPGFNAGAAKLKKEMRTLGNELNL
jgi:hypothetical protein